MSRHPDWDVDRARGEEAEGLYRRIRHGIVGGAAEVKLDDGAFKYGNAYFENECNTSQGWMPSGIATTKATTWVHVFWPVVVAVPVWLLRLVVDEHGESRECVTGSHPTKGRVLPVDKLIPLLMERASRAIYDEEDAA